MIKTWGRITVSIQFKEPHPLPTIQDPQSQIPWLIQLMPTSDLIIQLHACGPNRLTNEPHMMPCEVAESDTLTYASSRSLITMSVS